MSGALLAANYILALLGLIVLLNHQKLITLMLFVGLMVYFTLATGVLGYARFRVPFAPFYIIIGAVFVDFYLIRRANISFSDG